MSGVIIGDTIPYTQATAILNQTVYGTNWTADAASDVVVYSRIAGSTPNDVLDILSYPSQYSVAFIGSQEEVQVTLVTPSLAGDIVTIIRNTPASRTNLYSNTNFTPSMLNNDFGILTLVDQQAQLVNQLIGPRYNYSAVIAPNSSFPNANIILPILGANQVWLMNPTATEIIASTIGGGIPPGGGGVNPGLQNQVAWYATNGNVVSGLPTLANGVLITNNAGVPSISSSISIDSIVDDNGNPLISFPSPAIPNAVNFLFVLNNSTGNQVAIGTQGADSTIDLGFGIKGGLGNFYDITLTNSAKIRLYNAANSHYTGLTVATAQSTNIDFVLPAVDGTASAPLITNGSGSLSFLPGAYIDYSGTIVYTGFSGTPTTNIAKWKQIGKTVFVVIDMTGTSNTTGFSFTLPIVAGTTGATIAIGRCADNGTYSSAVYGTIGNSGTTVTLSISDSSTGWTNSGTKSVRCSFFYETA